MAVTAYNLEELPLVYSLKQNGMTHDHLKRKCHVMFTAVWKKNVGSNYVEWWGVSPDLIVTRKKPTVKGIDPLKAIRAVFKDKDFIKLIEMASKNALASFADYVDIKKGSKPIWTCIKVKQVKLCEEILETEIKKKAGKKLEIIKIPERHGYLKYGLPIGSTRAI